MKFQVGDRVAVYGLKSKWTGAFRQTGTICDSPFRKSPSPSHPILTVRLDRLSMEQEDVEYEFVHPKQCRKLVKKERLKIKLRLSSSGLPIAMLEESRVALMRQQAIEVGDDWREFVEVKKK